MGDNQDTEGGESLDLSGIFTELPRPPTPEPTFATYIRGESGRSQTFQGEGEDLGPDVKGAEWHEMHIRLVGSHPLWGHHLWNAARCFANFLDGHATEVCQGNNVLELGAGGGLPGLVAALSSAEKVVLTDYPDANLIDNLSHNVQANIPSTLRDRVAVQGYIWGSSVAPLLDSLASRMVEPDNGNGMLSEAPRFDVILMSDLIFNHSQHSALLKTCAATLSPRPPSQGHLTPCLLVFYTHHRPHLADRDLDFFRLAREEGWDCEEIVTEKMSAMFPEDSGDVDVRSTVHGWRLWRRSPSVGWQL